MKTSRWRVHPLLFQLFWGDALGFHLLLTRCQMDYYSNSVIKLLKKEGGPNGARTHDLHNAIVALFQTELWAHVFSVHVNNERYYIIILNVRKEIEWTWRDLNPRPRQCD